MTHEVEEKEERGEFICGHCQLELGTKVHPRVRNHGEGPYFTFKTLLGAVHILRKHILGSLNTLGGVVSAW